MFFLSLLSKPASAQAQNIYLAQTTAGAANGADCADARAVSSLGSKDWSPGNTIHLCGSITASAGSTAITALASGSSASIITVKFENGAVLQSPYFPTSGAINLNGQSYIAIDGGTNGLIQDTLNGTSGDARCIGGPCSVQQNSTGIYAIGSHDYEIKNLTIANIYMYTTNSSGGNGSVDTTFLNCIRFDGSNVLIHDNTMHDSGWCVDQIFNNGDANVSIYNNTIYNQDHGWIPQINSIGSSGPFSFYNNHVYSYALWDGAGHHDGIHCYTSAGGGATHITALNIYNNLFEGPVGVTITAHIFLEGFNGTPCMDSTSNAYIYNNVLFADANVSNGLMGLFAGNLSVYNNTLISTNGAASGSICFSSNNGVVGEVFKNNIVSGCDQLIAIQNNIPFTPDNNLYANGGGNAFVCQTNFYNAAQFSSWQSCIAGDSHSFYSASAGVNSNGTLQPTSPARAAGANLTGLNIGPLDTGAPQTFGAGGACGTGCIARQSSGAWDAGAYNSAGTSGGPPAPPSGLVAIVN